MSVLAAGSREPRPYASPYLAGFGLGLVLLAAFVVAGRGLGATGAFASAVGSGVAVMAPEHAAIHPSYTQYAGRAGAAFTGEWLVWQILGVLVGGFLSALAAGRLRFALERGPGVRPRGRVVQAFSGGVLMGLGAMLARGCTSGLALTGGAVLSVGAWLFVACAFGAGYAIAPLMRSMWRGSAGGVGEPRESGGLGAPAAPVGQGGIR